MEQLFPKQSTGTPRKPVDISNDVFNPQITSKKTIRDTFMYERHVAIAASELCWLSLKDCFVHDEATKSKGCGTTSPNWKLLQGARIRCFMPYPTKKDTKSLLESQG